MAGVGGPIKGIYIDGRNFGVDGEVDAQFFPGGFTNEVKPNGDGTQRLVKSIKPSELNDIPIVIDDSRGDEEFLQKVMNKHEFVQISFTTINGDVFSGLGQIVGDAYTSKKEQTKTVSFQGTFEKQG